jgi:hypothetical protein
MHDSRFRRVAADDNFSPPRSGLLARPDRVALWAVVMAVVAMIAGAASAHAGSSGGIGGPSAGNGGSTSVAPGCAATEFGRRTLRLGDCGNDVETLNWLLKSKDYRGTPLADEFQTPTAKSVRSFQQSADLRTTGVVDSATSSALAEAMLSQVATWYGPGFFGNQTACGKTLTRRTVGVAHRTLPCGSKVVLRYKGRYLRTTVIDRGPFSNGAKWDLTQAAAQKLRFEYTDELRVAKLAG